LTGRSLSYWRTWFFDCDGVLINSNRVKSEALYRVLSSYGLDAIRRMLAFHRNHGGIGRTHKFQWFEREVLGCHVPGRIDQWKEAYSNELWAGVRTCEEQPGLRPWLARLRSAGCHLFVVSGAEQDELRTILADRELLSLFDDALGSPDNKHEILSRLVHSGAAARPGIFVGDSRYDMEAAVSAGLDTAFLTGWSDHEQVQPVIADVSPTYVAQTLEDLIQQIGGR
jgi:phosphoglycolate phosphatase-like HAD superfamily hydrolase